MLHRNSLEVYLKENPEKEKKIKALVQASIENKILKFDSSILNIDFEYLTDICILKRDKAFYTIENFDVFCFIFIQEYKELSSKISAKDFRETAEILKVVCTEFQPSTFFPWFTKFKKYIWAHAICGFNEKNRVFSNYLEILNYDNDADEIISFIEGYSCALGVLNIEASTLYQDTKKLINHISTEVGLNSSYHLLYEGIVGKISLNKEFGLELYWYALNQEIREPNILAPVVQSLYENYRGDIKPILEEALMASNLPVGAINGLSGVKIIDEGDASFYLGIFDRNILHSHLLVPISKLLLAILQSNDTINQILVDKCFLRLKDLSSHDDFLLIDLLLKSLVFSDGHENQKLEWITILIGQPHFDKKYLTWINHYLYKIGKIGPFSQILNCLARNYSFHSVGSDFQSTLGKLSEKYEKELHRTIIDLLINSKAFYRFLGYDIFNHLTQIEFRFSYNILDLQPIEQYKLWVSIFQQYKDPKDILPALLPLLESSSPLVKESIICKIEELAVNYGGGIINVLNKNLDVTSEENRKIIERVEKVRMEHLNKFILVKKDIKELNPYYSQNKIFEEFRKNHGRMFSRQLQKGTKEKSSLLSLFKTVRLLKGGGWKTEGKPEVSKLGKVSTSLSLPRNYFIEPEEIDFDMGIELAKDWEEEDEFKIIKKLLEDE